MKRQTRQPQQHTGEKKLNAEKNGCFSFLSTAIHVKAQKGDGFFHFHLWKKSTLNRKKTAIS